MTKTKEATAQQPAATRHPAGREAASQDPSVKAVAKDTAAKGGKFALVGAVNTLVDIAISQILVHALGLDLIWASAISVFVCMNISFYFNYRFVFTSAKRKRDVIVQFYAVTLISGFGIQSLVIWLLTGPLGPTLTSIFGFTLLSLGAKCAAIALGMVWNFLAYNFIFTQKNDAVDDADLNNELAESSTF